MVPPKLSKDEEKDVSAYFHLLKTNPKEAKEAFHKLTESTQGLIKQFEVSKEKERETKLKELNKKLESSSNDTLRLGRELNDLKQKEAALKAQKDALFTTAARHTVSAVKGASSSGPSSRAIPKEDKTASIPKRKGTP